MMADQMGICAKHGLVMADYGWMHATWHCPKCCDFVAPASVGTDPQGGDACGSVRSIGDAVPAQPGDAK